jgi:hypothetical protein
MTGGREGWPVARRRRDTTRPLCARRPRARDRGGAPWRSHPRLRRRRRQAPRHDRSTCPSGRGIRHRSTNATTRQRRRRPSKCSARRRRSTSSIPSSRFIRANWVRVSTLLRSTCRSSSLRPRLRPPRRRLRHRTRLSRAVFECCCLSFFFFFFFFKFFYIVIFKTQNFFFNFF